MNNNDIIKNADDPTICEFAYTYLKNKSKLSKTP